MKLNNSLQQSMMMQTLWKNNNNNLTFYRFNKEPIIANDKIAFLCTSQPLKAINTLL